MFFIVNKTKGTIVLSDISVTLGPRQAMDLDKMMNRSKSEASKMLKAANHKGHIDIRIKDGKKPSSKSSKPSSINELDNFKHEMIEEIKGVLSCQSKPAPQGGISKGDLAEFAKQLIANMPKPETVIIHGEAKETRTDEDVEVKVDELGEMNKRIVNKIVENVESTDIKYEEQKQKNDLDSNIIELEGLLDL